MTAMYRQQLAGHAASHAPAWRPAPVDSTSVVERDPALPVPRLADDVVPRRAAKKVILGSTAFPAATPQQASTSTLTPAGDVEPGCLTLNQTEAAYLRSNLSCVSDREFEVLVELCAGGRNEEVAKRLFIALPTLRTHLSRLNDKLGTLSKSELIGHVGAMLVDGYRTGLLRAGFPRTAAACGGTV